jgi:hypothetical protein
MTFSVLQDTSLSIAISFDGQSPRDMGMFEVSKSGGQANGTPK